MTPEVLQVAFDYGLAGFALLVVMALIIFLMKSRKGEDTTQQGSIDLSKTLAITLGTSIVETNAAVARLADTVLAGDAKNQAQLKAVFENLGKGHNSIEEKLDIIQQDMAGCREVLDNHFAKVTIEIKQIKEGLE